MADKFVEGSDESALRKWSRKLTKNFVGSSTNFGGAAESPTASNGDGLKWTSNVAITAVVLPCLFVLSMLLSMADKVLVKLLYFCTAPEDVELVFGFAPAGQRFVFPFFISSFTFVATGLLSYAFHGLMTGTWRFSFSKLTSGHGSGVDWAIVGLTGCLSTVFGKSSLEVLTLSMYAIVRASGIPITAMVRCFVLKQPPTWERFQEVLLTTAGILVSTYAFSMREEHKAPSAPNDAPSSMDWKVGVVFLLGSVCMNTINSVYEEKLIAVHDVHPLMVLSIENALSFAASVPVLAVATVTGYEDLGTSATMALTVRRIQVLLLICGLGKATFHISQIFVTKIVGSFWKIAARSLKIVNMWLVELFAYYVLHNTHFGAAWVHPWSDWQLFGAGMVTFAFFQKAMQSVRQKTEKKKKKASTWSAGSSLGQIQDCLLGEEDDVSGK